MMENRAILSPEQLIPDVVKNRSDFVKVNETIYAVILPNEILYVRKEELNNFEQYSINLQKKEEKSILSVTIVPTLDCNLNCIYCYARGGEQQDMMPPSMAQKFLEKLYNPKKDSAIHLKFSGGGEPFLNFDCIREATRTSKEITNNVSLHCVTNGTFNKEQLFWILEERPHMRISYDSISQGLQRCYKNGADSTNVVRRNIEKLIEDGIETVTQTIITSLNVSRMKKIVSEVAGLGIKTIKMEPVYITENSRGNQKLNVSPSEYVLNFLNAVRYIKESNLEIQIDTAFFSRPTLGNYCSLPIGNIILTPRGDISGCVEITNNCDYHSDDIFYGKFEEKRGELKLDESKKKSFGRFHFSNYKNCLICNLKLICKGGCPMRRIWNQQNHSCEISKRLIPQILKLFYEDSSYTKIFIKNET